MLECICVYVYSRDDVHLYLKMYPTGLKIILKLFACFSSTFLNSLEVVSAPRLLIAYR